MFEKGDFVVYGSKGVCEVRDIAPVDLPGVDRNRLYYIMSPVYSGNGTVYSPVDSTKTVIRPVMTREEVMDFMESIPSIGYLFVENEKNREDVYKNAMRTCQAREWVSIMKTLYSRQSERVAAGKKITALDERYLKAAENELYGELSLVLDISREEAEANICKYLEKE